MIGFGRLKIGNRQSLRDFHVRSLERALSDGKARRAAAQQAIQRQQTIAAFELSGLKARMQQALTQAAYALDTSEGYLTRSLDDDEEITRFENEASAAKTQILHLEAELELYNNISNLIYGYEQTRPNGS